MELLDTVFVRPFLILTLFILRVTAVDVQVVISSEAQPYMDCVASMQVASADYVYQIKTLEELKKESKYSESKVFVAVGSQAAQYLHKHLPLEKKLVYTMVNNPHELGLLQGRQAFGVRTDINIKERFQLIKKMMPKAKKIGFLYWSADGEPEYLVSAKQYTPEGMTLSAHGVESQRHAARAIKQMLKQDIDVILTVPDRNLMTISTIRTLLRKSLDHRVPVCAYSSSFVKAGATFGFAINPEVQGTQAVKFIDVIYEKKTKDFPIISIDDYHKYVRPVYDIAVNGDVSERLDFEFDAEKHPDVIWFGRLR